MIDKIEPSGPAVSPRPASVKKEYRSRIIFLEPHTLEIEMRLADFDAQQCVIYVRKAVQVGEISGWVPMRTVPVALIDPFTSVSRDLGRRLDILGEEFWPESRSGLRWVVASEDITLDDAEAPTSPAGKITRKISFGQFDNLYSAVCYANSRGWVLNVEMTITWPLLGLRSDTEVGRRLAQFLHLLYHFCRDKRNLDFVLIWVMERGAERGLHTHLAVHLPIAVKPQFRRWVRRALKRMTGVDPDRVIITPGGQRLKPLHFDFRSDYSAYSQWQWFKYMIKGIDPTAICGPDDESVERVWRVIDVRPEPVGIMSTKRVGWSKLIGPEARDDDGFFSPFRAGEPLFPDYSGPPDGVSSILKAIEDWPYRRTRDD
jgi:hypothetical protein